MQQPEFWRRETRGARIAAAALAPLGVLYGASVAWKHRLSNPYHASVPVICVGNLTVGGAGKTPVAIAIARMLQQQGVLPAFLSRGYGRNARNIFVVDANAHDAGMAGDEALLLASVAPTIVSADRAAGARMAEMLRAEVIIMDDGHQNFSLHKDRSIVVVDGETGFDNGRIIPAGPLREPVQQGLDRADAVIVIGDGSPPISHFARPVLRAHLAAARHVDQRVVAFAGIGRPEKFFATLSEAGAAIVETHAFADHHGYSNGEIARLRDHATRENATLITTEKDFVRLAPKEREGIEVLAVRAVFDDEAAITNLIAPVITRSACET